MNDDGFSIKIAARKSGLTPFLIRAWERRYNAVEPFRTPTNQRRYTHENIDRLTKLRQTVDAGYRIGDIAHMSNTELENLAAIKTGPAKDMLPFQPDFSSTVIESSEEVNEYINGAYRYIQDMNEAGLENLLSRASITMTQPEFLDKVILPLTKMVGDKWHIGEIRISQEHMATWVIKSILSGLLRSHRFLAGAPMMVVTTPAGQLHEIGALAVAISGAHCGWNVTYLGPDLPAEEIAAMALRTQASLVALSLVYPGNDPLLPDELGRLKYLLPRHVSIVAGGAASLAYRKIMDSLGIINLFTLVNFREYLGNFQTRLQEGSIS